MLAERSSTNTRTQHANMIISATYVVLYASCITDGGCVVGVLWPTITGLSAVMSFDRLGGPIGIIMMEISLKSPTLFVSAPSFSEKCWWNWRRTPTGSSLRPGGSILILIEGGKHDKDKIPGI